MKKYALLLWLLLPAGAFAMSCPTNGSIIDKGDSVQEVLQRCGAPADQISYAKATPITEQLEYSNFDGSLTYKHVVTHMNTVNIIELAYNGSRLSPNTLKFVDGKLASWE